VRSKQDREAPQCCLDQLTAWATTWGIAFNVKKCMVLHFGTSNQYYPYYMNGESL
jgi:hypothetical protein